MSEPDFHNCQSTVSSWTFVSAAHRALAADGESAPPDSPGGEAKAADGASVFPVPGGEPAVAGHALSPDGESAAAGAKILLVPGGEPAVAVSGRPWPWPAQGCDPHVQSIAPGKPADGGTLCLHTAGLAREGTAGVVPASVGGAEDDTTGEECLVLRFKEELAILQSKPEWEEFKKVTEDNLAGGPSRVRQALSQHATNACQPLKRDGPGVSLKAAGLDTALPADGGIKVRLRLPHSFEVGDFLNITYESPAMSSREAAKKQACFDVLCFLLAMAPEKLQTHPSNWRQGLQSIQTVKAKGRALHQVYAAAVGNSSRWRKCIADPAAMPRPRKLCPNMVCFRFWNAIRNASTWLLGRMGS